MAGDTRTLVVFDVDGTLTDSRPSIYASYRHAALNAGLPIPSDDMLAIICAEGFRTTSGNSSGSKAMPLRRSSVCTAGIIPRSA